MKKIIWTKSAVSDLKSIIEYIKIDNKELAKRIFFEIKKECNNVSFFTDRKRIVPELGQIGVINYRENIYKRWRIVYKSDSSKVYVLLVADTRRNLQDILFQRLLKR
ncbi:MAG: Plasmid stabilization protein [uncultured Campylobacterales bacterium]|uniref:Plasmid stabilization protein n=1 Tax=uncultured Campylobacterales bacterium TaxID=352960 RepID=A0A6S6SCN7_9BACT|nr:MAG: Plasmid stabilization protein [uncultured Campylobacterales bacterium]